MNTHKIFQPLTNTQFLKKGGFKVFYIDKTNVSSLGKFLKSEKQKAKFPSLPDLTEQEAKDQEQTNSLNLQEFSFQDKKSQQMQEQKKQQKQPSKSQSQFKSSALPEQIQRKISEIIKMNAVQSLQQKQQAQSFRQRVKDVIKKMNSKANNPMKDRKQQQRNQCSSSEQRRQRLSENESISHNEIKGIKIGKSIIRKNGKKARQRPIIVSSARQETNRNKSKQLLKDYQQADSQSIVQKYQEAMYGQKYEEMRITRNKIKEKSFGEANFIQLQIKPKFNKQAAEVYKVKEKLKSKPSKSEEDTIVKKKIKKVKRNSSFEQKLQYLINKKQKSILDQILVNNLPPRNPNVKHQHNCVHSQKIVLKHLLKDNRLYFASEILNYNKGNKALNIKCGLRMNSFIEQTLKSSQNCKTIDEPPHESQIKKIKLKRNFEYTNKKTLVLDLDQTLVHSQGLNEVANKQIFPFSFEFDKTTRHYTIRNYARDFIRNLSQKFYIVVFTSAVEGYADNILEHIDPQEKYIQHRLYRSNCYLHGEKYPYIKDLRILNRDLSQIIIVDNSLYAFWFNIDNGVPITSFTGIQDEQLRKLEKYLLLLQNVDDVRKVNRRAFHLHLYQEHQTSKQLLKGYCELMRQEAYSQDQQFQDM